MIKNLISEDRPRLERVLQEIHEHGGDVSLWHDIVWLQRVQAEKPAWAIAIFEKWAKQPHVHSETIKNATR